ncbi:uncharacterized protein Tco025E_07068 [Trypanosoma conorhini]|uniref:Uncharacterized protein n=1 Tax=Trypanosoma conorhini TaxID=83891 RepID=A0A3R7M4M7_9TRYP|nr:uncharacterized protein Tco025E_07068 [Trypanosoma conorhini]RNF08945.1 hypothetical protein Tco025E_07068 [Trypanosoma conorhini]
MCRTDTDGSLSDVNPDLLELSKDPVAWREQRRHALQFKVFGHGGGRGGAEGSADPAPTKNIPQGAKASNASAVGAESRQKMEEREAYVLEQLKSHKRRREDAATSAGAPTGSVSSAGLSTKEKILQRLKKPN